ncbi:MAG: Orotidine 5'-phosphate decarboxylase [Parcubacteria group bacterium GW2011_GWA2_43_11]|nr:MAG: Orotidine 5'-phosphate decarboxylase [Parcubacteria group bacterium GW2011_GWA2_43_11]
MKEFTPLNKSLIFAADIENLGLLEYFAKELKGINGLSAFKVGFRLGFRGLEKAVNIIKSSSNGDMVVIYDHQKAGNDIPDMGKSFAHDLKSAGVDVAILFPFTGPRTQEVWTESCLSAGLQVMTGGIMTHPEFLVSEGGYIADDAPERIYLLAAHYGVRHFVVPGNKPEWVRRIRGWLVDILGEGNFTLSAPGFITQGGAISECGLVAGNFWHAIVGSGIYQSNNPREVAVKLASQILALK